MNEITVDDLCVGQCVAIVITRAFSEGYCVSTGIRGLVTAVNPEFIEILPDGERHVISLHFPEDAEISVGLVCE